VSSDTSNHFRYRLLKVIESIMGSIFYKIVTRFNKEGEFLSTLVLPNILL